MFQEEKAKDQKALKSSLGTRKRKGTAESRLLGGVLHGGSSQGKIDLKHLRHEKKEKIEEESLEEKGE